MNYVTKSCCYTKCQDNDKEVQEGAFSEASKLREARMQMFQDDYGILRILARPAINEHYSPNLNFAAFFFRQPYFILVDFFRRLTALFKSLIIDPCQIDGIG